MSASGSGSEYGDEGLEVCRMRCKLQQKDDKLSDQRRQIQLYHQQRLQDTADLREAREKMEEAEKKIGDMERLNQELNKSITAAEQLVQELLGSQKAQPTKTTTTETTTKKTTTRY